MTSRGPVRSLRPPNWLPRASSTAEAAVGATIAAPVNRVPRAARREKEESTAPAFEAPLDGACGVFIASPDDTRKRARATA